jgi:hypothetical protein
MQPQSTAAKAPRKLGKAFAGLLALAALTSACATIKEHAEINKPLGKELEAYVGGSVFKVNRNRDLPNAFGGPDIFGGKVFAGYTDVRYQGLDAGGKIILRITEVETQSTETSMSRYGRSSATYSGRTTPSGGVQGTIDINHPPQGSTTMLPPNTAEIALDPTNSKDIDLAGITLTVISVNSQTLKYRLTKH